MSVSDDVGFHAEFTHNDSDPLPEVQTMALSQVKHKIELTEGMVHRLSWLDD